MLSPYERVPNGIVAGSELENDFLFSSPIGNATTKFEVRKDDRISLVLYQVDGSARSVGIEEGQRSLVLNSWSRCRPSQWTLECPPTLQPRHSGPMQEPYRLAIRPRPTSMGIVTKGYTWPPVRQEDRPSHSRCCSFLVCTTLVSQMTRYHDVGSIRR